MMGPLNGTVHHCSLKHSKMSKILAKMVILVRNSNGNELKVSENIVQ